MSKKNYKNPPIEEAICQFTFAEHLPWSSETPRQLFEKVRDRYPAMPTQQQILQANMAPVGGSESPTVSLAPTERIVFADAENLSRFSVGPQNTAIHRAKPYLGFEEEMLPRIRKDIPHSVEFLQSNPLFSAVSVRYINRIEVAAADFDLPEFFAHINSIDVPSSVFDGTVTGLFYRTNVTQNEAPLSLALTFGSIAAAKDNAAFVLDIDLTYNFAEPVTSEIATAKIVEVKSIENSIFESFITDRTRELFK